jgi:hypothetical protein
MLFAFFKILLTSVGEESMGLLCSYKIEVIHAVGVNVERLSQGNDAIDLKGERASRLVSIDKRQNPNSHTQCYQSDGENGGDKNPVRPPGPDKGNSYKSPCGQNHGYRHRNPDRFLSEKPNGRERKDPADSENAK